jgi:hypothetical protein
MRDYVATPDMRILHVLMRMCSRSEMLYCWPSQQRILEWVHRFTGRAMSRRTLNRHLGALERDCWLRRQRRHETGELGDLVLHSSLYIMTRRACKWARSTISRLWNWHVPAAKSLIDIAVPLSALTLAQDTYSYTHRAARGPPKRPGRR